jgi:serine protease Do
MSSWVLAAVVGAAVGQVAYVQSVPVTQDLDVAALVAEQAGPVKVFGGTHIGVTLRDLDDDDQKKSKATNGVMVESVETDSPAAKAGIKQGDVIVEFDGERVRSSRQLSRLVQETVPGRSVTLAALRDGQRVSLTVQPRDGRDGAYNYFNRFEFPMTKITPTPAPAKPRALPFTLFGSTGRLGIGVSELSPQLAEYFGTKDGVLVTSVNDDSVAAKTGVKAGDVITSLDGGSINDAEDLRRRAQRLEAGDEFTLGVVRDKKALTLKGKLDAPRRTTGRTIL